MPISSSTSSSNVTVGSGAVAPDPRGLRWAWSCVPVIRWTAAWLVGAEIAVAVLGPFVVPDWIYLRVYLGQQSIANTRSFANTSTSYLMWDPVTGWRNRPSVRRSLWQVDERGARVSTARHRAPARQVLFLGDSVTNGGTGVSNDETVSALVEDAQTASINFATMLYGVDQAYLALSQQLRDIRPSVIVVGLTETGVEGLGNRYIPLRRRTEANMPFLKPRYVLENGRLALVALPPIAAYDDLLGRATLLRDLAATDDYYRNFSAYQRCGFLPVSGAAWSAWGLGASLVGAVTADTPYSDILIALMGEIVQEGRRRGAPTVFVLNSTAAQTWPAGWRQKFPDRYSRLLQTLRSRGFVVLDARDALLKNGRPPGELYSADGIHYRVEGNRAIAAALRPLLPDGGF